jgi:hypothetical protein
MNPRAMRSLKAKDTFPEDAKNMRATEKQPMVANSRLFCHRNKICPDVFCLSAAIKPVREAKRYIPNIIIYLKAV